ncbi:MAG: UDP-2,3-diacylglucosamine diphosphatase LpxI [Alphaproteobacteria bacterium]|nr:UDP-2,3-diacylglucosamine diphosphatase LpxI [Alphaproteobacteria bacterium]
MSTSPEAPFPLGIIAGAGAMPFAVAESVRKQGRSAVLFALRGICDPVRVASYRHHWIAIGQVGRATRLFRQEGCRDLVFIGALTRPSLAQIRLDLKTLRLFGTILQAFRGGDDHLLTGVGRILERDGFRLLGIRDVAPDLLMPEGCITQVVPGEAAAGDIEKGRAVLTALGGFDIGQAVVVIDSHIVALEDIEGTDALLARVARLRRQGRLRAPEGRGVLVKAVKSTQDLRFDLPTIGRKTVEGVAAAGLAGIAVVAGTTIVSEPQSMIVAADAKGLYIVGVAQ